MLSLERIGKRENTATVVLRGETVTVRGLTARDHARIDQALPPPTPPVGPDPSKGDLAPHVERRDDPAYRSAVMRRVAQRMLAQFAAAVDWQTAEGVPWTEAAAGEGPAAEQKLAAYLETVEEEAARAELSRAELDVVLETSERLERGGDARGN